MLKLFGEVWWNYDHRPFNYKGILCLESTIAWGFLALFIFGFFNKLVEAFVMSIAPAISATVGTALSIIYILDFSYHFGKNLNANFGTENCESCEGGDEDRHFSHIMAKIRRK